MVVNSAEVMQRITASSCSPAKKPLGRSGQPLLIDLYCI
jgi:hypothetical protein